MRARIFLGMAAAIVAACTAQTEEVPQTFPLENISISAGAPLHERLSRNKHRLEDTIYQPDMAIADSKDWPGDYVGRIILGTTLSSRALHEEPAFLPEILRRLPGSLNEKGYLGDDFSPEINEQQLSGHGWLLRGLCEYYKWKGDESMVPLIRTIVDNLFLPGAGKYGSYPIDPALHSNEGGEASGAINSSTSGWILSTDVGCLFIGMAGLVDAYEVLGDKKLRPVIEEMMERFLEIDLVGIQMQTHATLSALRGMLKYYSLTGEERWLKAAADRWAVYENEGMTCTYANYNWFGRKDSWTEPCAVVDSYIVAFELWKATMDPHYRDMAELIYYNALSNGQRDNGGFGCDNCPSPEDPFLKVIIPEATWCCTMRGGEGLPRVAESAWARKGSSLYVPFFFSGILNAPGLTVRERTSYPDRSLVVFTFEDNASGVDRILVPELPWAEGWKVTVNDTETETVQEDGFLAICKPFASGDVVKVSFVTKRKIDEWNGRKRYFFGPLMQCIVTGSQERGIAAFKAVGHMMDPAVLTEGYSRRVLF